MFAGLSLPSLALVLWAVAGPLLAGGVTWAGMSVRNDLEVRGAVAGERSKQIGVCAQQLAAQAAILDANTMAGIGEAGAAADAIPAAPEERAALVALCKADPACRDRGTLP